MAVEILGGWQDPCPDDGLGHRGSPGCGEKTKEKTSFYFFIKCVPKIVYLNCNLYNTRSNIIYS